MAANGSKGGQAGDDIRRRAEARLLGEPAEGESAWPLDARALVHELRVHQIQLEMQNIELQRLDRERASFENLYEFAPVGYLVLDPGGRILACNVTVARMLGLHRKELIGRPLETLVDPQDRDAAYLCRQKLAGGEACPCEFRMLRAGAGPLWVRMDGARATGHDGGCELRVLLTDISAQRQAEREYREMETQLQHLQRMESIGRLAGGVAHELNNVLAAILAVTESMAEGREDASSPQRIIAAACGRGRAITQGLLVFSRKDVGAKSAVDLNLQVEEAAAVVRASCDPRVEVELDLDPAQPRVLGNSSTLGTILLNLCRNALDAMPEGGRLLLGTRRGPGSEVQLRIRDDGEGMCGEVLAKATEPFFTTKPVGRGTGLGLAIVHSLVQAHQGTLELKSEPGRGTEVAISLPAHPDPPPDPAPAPSHDLSGLVMVLVDDEEVIRETMAMLLARSGNRVHTATGGEEALRLLASGLDPDILILDVRLPDIDGVEVLRRLRASGNRVPVLLFTGSLDSDLRALAAGTPRTGLVAKPATLEDMRCAISRLLGTA